MILYDARGSRKKKKRMGYKNEAGRQEGRMKGKMTVDHKTTLNALQNPVRRKIVKALAERRNP
jgi:hypothetical protein